jgi:pimeloyl-ACP methyl ester carboxylesterase
MANWQTINIANHPAEIFVPEVASPHGETVLYLHGVHQGRLSEHPLFGQLFGHFGFRCVAPMTGRSWWTNRIWPEFDAQISAEEHVTKAVLTWLAETWNCRPPQIALLGTSMGGQGALRMAYKHPRLFPVVAALAPAIDYHERMATSRPSDPDYGPLHELYEDPEQARQDSATLWIHPLNYPVHQFFACDPTDSWWNSVDRLRMKLSSLGIPFECDLDTIVGGHGFGYYTAQAEKTIPWIADRLRKERLRLPLGSV